MISPICPFPPVGLFAEALKSGEWRIDYGEGYQKQSYRNRYCIATANGLLYLTIPTRSTGNIPTLTRDVKIANEKAWQKQHIRAIQSAYGSSPFFEYYFPKIVELLDYEMKTIGDLFEKSSALFIKLLKIHLPIIAIQESNHLNETNDWRIKGKQVREFNELHSPHRYLQVFADRFPFQGNLCVIDLLFNLGPQSAAHLMRDKE